MSDDWLAAANEERVWTYPLPARIKRPTAKGAGMARTCLRVAASGPDVEYKSCAGTVYVSLGYHRKGAGKKLPKALWVISRADECHTFCTSERRGWCDPDDQRWAVGKDAKRELGVGGERLAFFPRPTNTHDAWHGYPVSGKRGAAHRRRPPDEIVHQWYEEGWISFTTHERLIGGRL